jgi:L-rhamnose-H+ transport protein
LKPELVGGIIAVLIGGIFNGSFVAPMKKLNGWRWGHGWFAYSLVGLIVVPLAAAWLTVPELWTAISTAPASALWSAILFGVGWGVGSVLFGIGVDRMGLAVGYGLILGLIAPIGTFVPLLVLHPDRLWTKQGGALLIGTLIVLGGIYLCAKAGKIREEAGGGAVRPRQGFGMALLICFLAGVFSPMLNLSFAFAAGMQQRAEELGASPGNAANTIWLVTLVAGFLPNALYALKRVRDENALKEFENQAGANWFWSSLMGVLCFASFLVYGFGASALGDLGAVVGWPLFMSMALITSNTLGKLSGEWKGAPAQAVRLSLAGIGMLVVAIVVISLGNA